MGMLLLVASGNEHVQLMDGVGVQVGDERRPGNFRLFLQVRNYDIRKRGVGFKATQSSLGVSEDSKDIKDPKRSGKSQVKVYLELNL